MLIGGLLTFLLSAVSHAAVPTLWWDPATPEDEVDRFRAAWAECVVLARVAAVTQQDPTCDREYQRYFEPAGANFVQGVLRTIGGIPLNGQINAATAQQHLQNLGPGDFPEKFSKLRICLGEPPDLADKDKGFCASNNNMGAHCIRPCEGEATIILCSGMLNYPKASEIVSPPAWARDGQGRPKPGYGCENVGHVDPDGD
jgi:hypothetical protein